MKFAVDIPNFGEWADPRVVAEFAAGIEAAGWDGLSIWDHILVMDGWNVGDPWIALAAAAAATDRIRLFTGVTPIPRRAPWKLAREAVSLDHLSGGRFGLGVGLGWPTDPEFTRFDGPTDVRTRADMLDEGLEILEGLWSGEPFAYSGDHYTLRESTFMPTPLQEPRIPIWVAGMWPNRRPMRRAARYDGVMPIYLDDKGEFKAPHPDTVAEVAAYVTSHRESDDPFDLTVAAMAYADDEFDIAAFAEAGATWWLEQWHPGATDHDAWLERVLAGPPKV